MVKTYSYTKDGSKFISPHFQIGEFKSYCDDWHKLTTDTIKIDDNLPVMLEKLYNYLDNKFGIGYIYITSGYRSYDFEMYLAGFTGYHYQGKAADIMCYDKKNKLIPGTQVACAAQTVGFNGIGYIGNAVHVDVRDNKSWFDESKGCAGVNDFYSYFKIAKPSLPNPIARNKDKIQIEVVESQLHCRLGHSTDSVSLGFIKPGIYNFVQYFEDGKYTWYEIEKGYWIASNGEWVKKLNIEIPQVIEESQESQNNGNNEPKEQDRPIIPDEPINDDNKENSQEKEDNFLIALIKAIIDLIKRLFK